MPSVFRLAPAAVRTVVRLFAAPGGTAPVPVGLPAGRSERVLASVAHRGLQVSAVISFALLLGLLAFGTHTAWLGSVKLAFGTTMIAEGVLLATDWRDARQLVLARLSSRRAWARSPILTRLAWKLASPALQLLGVIWLAAGLLTALLGLQAFF